MTRQNISVLCPDAVVIGGGPAGLMAAERLLAAGVSVALYDAMPSVGRKFLLAGVGGMNITKAEASDRFNSHYYEAQNALGPMLQAFDANALRDWVHQLGIDTFVGSSGKVFPTEMKAAPLLRAWLQRLKQAGLQLFTRHQWLGWQGANLVFDSPKGRTSVKPKVVVLALGGASWSRLGSTGVWQPWLAEQQVGIEPLKPANCGFTRPWTEQFTAAGCPIKAVAGWVKDTDSRSPIRGELLLTQDGIEGSLVYRFSAQLREQLLRSGKATLYLDLLPDRSLQDVLAVFKQAPKGKTLSRLLSSKLGFSAAKRQLLFECVEKSQWAKPLLMAAHIKRLAVELEAMRPMDEAISCAGGVRFSALDKNLMLTAMPGVFCAGEMLDWEAPTGGYLLTACFATGRWAGDGAARYIEH
ncbi:TIGR03862 family flavoprotein [Simiduia curdlanivorans]|uniref:TIGR03862 family flavoprotein n=1 Tax=Simiduia curdlanivorans TaxID=1492769 RepID=A0ABV8V493_9GAMM|nr:TIGR03862 family flavoprotein [Simiduia curdlanivorans]MDN3640061.1 TIGR03862 family flavoprotein [Simiduia curdlanivorans]